MGLPKTPGRTTAAFGFSYVERTLKDCLGQRLFNKKEKDQVLEFFRQWEPQPSCAFCGSPEVMRWDDLIPVIKDGETVLGNMVLACARCDNSKGKRLFDEWMSSTLPKSPSSQGTPNVKDRIKHIEAYTTTFGYICKPLNQRLTRTEQERRTDLLRRLNGLREEVNSLIRDYRERTGNR